MASKLVVCLSCNAHVLVGDARCVHCGASLRAKSVGRTAGVVLMGLTLAACTGDDTVATGGEDESESMTSGGQSTMSTATPTMTASSASESDTTPVSTSGSESESMVTGDPGGSTAIIIETGSSTSDGITVSDTGTTGGITSVGDTGTTTGGIGMTSMSDTGAMDTGVLTEGPGTGFADTGIGFIEPLYGVGEVGP